MRAHLRLKCEIWEKWGAIYGRNGWVGGSAAYGEECECEHMGWVCERGRVILAQLLKLFRSPTPFLAYVAHPPFPISQNLIRTSWREHRELRPALDADGAADGLRGHRGHRVARRRRRLDGGGGGTPGGGSTPGGEGTPVGWGTPGGTTLPEDELVHPQQALGLVEQTEEERPPPLGDPPP